MAAAPPLSTVRSRASIFTVRISTAEPAAAGAARTASSSWTGFVSRISRWSVQSPPLTTLVGMPGSGVIDPNAPPPPANWKAVT
jgi:hypothetical protein